jgi:ssDNA-binding Zn-finger/Zn-ribbon topoisomerase 1|nr:MAG TPA: Transcription initiation factor IIE, alpha FINGER, Transcription [Bacteriophage sp.]
MKRLTMRNRDGTVSQPDYKCPKCGCGFVSKIDGEFVAGMHYPYCYICGQRIDWEGVK